jgi:catechol 2,3-dioxygenase-like lactoylglutathione lyase family enzyme
MSPDRAGAGRAIDHVALPLRDTEAMVAFYRSLGLAVDESTYLVRVHLAGALAAALDRAGPASSKDRSSGWEGVVWCLERLRPRPRAATCSSS